MYFLIICESGIIRVLTHLRQTRVNGQSLVLPRFGSGGHKTIVYQIVKQWNNLPLNGTELTQYCACKSAVKKCSKQVFREIKKGSHILIRLNASSLGSSPWLFVKFVSPIVLVFLYNYRLCRLHGDRFLFLWILLFCSMNSYNIVSVFEAPLNGNIPDICSHVNLLLSVNYYVS